MLNAFGDENELKDPRAAILLNETFDGVPPCLFIVAELDPVRDLSYGMNARECNNKKVLFTLTLFSLSRATRESWRKDKTGATQRCYAYLFRLSRYQN